MKYNAIIFDLDGVICFTDKYHYLAWKQIADEEGIEFNEEINKRLRGVSRMASLDIILEKAARAYSKKEKQALADRKNAAYVRLLNQMTPASLSDDTVRTLQEFKKMGIKTVIASSSKNAKLILHKVGLENFFDGVADGTVIAHSKPHPEVFIKAIDLIKARPHECLVVEDAVAGIEAAYRGGFDSAGLGDAVNHKKVTYKLGKLSDLLDIVRGGSATAIA